MIKGYILVYTIDLPLWSMTRKGDRVIRNAILVGEDKAEGEAKPFGAYSSHIILPGAWRGKKLKIEVIND